MLSMKFLCRLVSVLGIVLALNAATMGSTAARNNDNVTVTFKLILQGNVTPDMSFTLFTRRLMGDEVPVGPAPAPFCGPQDIPGISECKGNGTVYTGKDTVPRGTTLLYVFSMSSSRGYGKVLLKGQTAFTKDTTVTVRYQSSQVPTKTPKAGAGGMEGTRLPFSILPAPGRSNGSTDGVLGNSVVRSLSGSLSLAENTLTGTILPEPAVSRHEAIGWARTQAKTFGEGEPVLLDTSLGTYLDELKKMYPEGGPVDGANVVPADTQVWMVRMKGSFMAPHPPPNVSLKPEPGTMYIIIDAETGKKISAGFRPDP